MADWEATQKIDYTPSGEDLGGFAEKYQAVVEEQIFSLLNLLRRGGATAGLDATDATAYTMRINTADNGLYFRNADNTDWILIGYVEPWLGLKATDIGAIINGGGLNKITCGTQDNLPNTPSENKTNDFYFAYDTSRLFRWTGTTWKTFLSLNFGDMLNYEKYCISRNELSSLYNDKGKIPVLDSETGKGNFDITGSPEQIWGILIELQELNNGDALVYNAEKERWVNLPNDAIDETRAKDIFNLCIADMDFEETAISVAAKRIEETLDIDNRIKEVVEELTPAKQDTVLYVGEDTPENTKVWIKAAVTIPEELYLKDITTGATQPESETIWINTGA